jgi:uncharacterized membrane protein
MDALITTLLWFNALGCALLGGVYFAFSAFIMTALLRAGHAGTTAMNSINAVILRSLFMPLFIATTLASGALLVLGLIDITSLKGVLMALGGLSTVGGMFLVTLLGNVPLNHALTAVTTESRTGTAIWQDYVKRWTRLNHIRTLACLVAAALFMATLKLL